MSILDVTFVETTVRNQGMPGQERRYDVYRAPDRSSAMDFLRRTDVREERYYVIVETPQGNIGRDLVMIFDEASEQLIEYVPRAKLSTPVIDPENCCTCGYPVLPYPVGKGHVLVEQMRQDGGGWHCANCRSIQCVPCNPALQPKCPFCHSGLTMFHERSARVSSPTPMIPTRDVNPSGAEAGKLLADLGKALRFVAVAIDDARNSAIDPDNPTADESKALAKMDEFKRQANDAVAALRMGHDINRTPVSAAQIARDLDQLCFDCLQKRNLTSLSISLCSSAMDIFARSVRGVQAAVRDTVPPENSPVVSAPLKQQATPKPGAPSPVQKVDKEALIAGLRKCTHGLPLILKAASRAAANPVRHTPAEREVFDWMIKFQCDLDQAITGLRRGKTWNNQPIAEETLRVNLDELCTSYSAPEQLARVRTTFSEEIAAQFDQVVGEVWDTLHGVDTCESSTPPPSRVSPAPKAPSTKRDHQSAPDAKVQDLERLLGDLPPCRKEFVNDQHELLGTRWRADNKYNVEDATVLEIYLRLCRLNFAEGFTGCELKQLREDDNPFLQANFNGANSFRAYRIYRVVAGEVYLIGQPNLGEVFRSMVPDVSPSPPPRPTAGNTVRQTSRPVAPSPSAPRNPVTQLSPQSFPIPDLAGKKQIPVVYQHRFQHSEWIFLLMAPIRAFVLVAGIDGNVDENEKQFLLKVLSAAEKNHNPFFRELMCGAAKEARLLLTLTLADMNNLVNSFGQLDAVIGRRLNETDKLSFKKCLVSIAVGTAESSGGRFGTGATSPQEKQAINVIRHSLGLRA